MFMSNLSREEEFRLTGTLRRESIDELLDASSRLEALGGVDAHIEEALAQYPAEDFLEGVKQRLGALMKNVRGANKDELQGIIEALDDIAQTTFYAADYGRDELRKALRTVKG